MPQLLLWLNRLSWLFHEGVSRLHLGISLSQGVGMGTGKLDLDFFPEKRTLFHIRMSNYPEDNSLCTHCLGGKKFSPGDGEHPTPVGGSLLGRSTMGFNGSW